MLTSAKKGYVCSTTAEMSVYMKEGPMLKNKCEVFSQIDSCTVGHELINHPSNSFPSDVNGLLDLPLALG